MSLSKQADDIARLKIELNLPDLDYVDISAQMEISHALKRWPFLTEFGFATESRDTQSLPVTEAVRQGAFGTAT
ncbi:cellulose biosynthesis protein BcsR [Pseudomonas triticifolii]|nr:cellulose biosynthesis protein BcsR [Pseudomonas triticifolii]